MSFTWANQLKTSTDKIYAKIKVNIKGSCLRDSVLKTIIRLGASDCICCYCNLWIFSMLCPHFTVNVWLILRSLHCFGHIPWFLEMSKFCFIKKFSILVRVKNPSSANSIYCLLSCSRVHSVISTMLQIRRNFPGSRNLQIEWISPNHHFRYIFCRTGACGHTNNAENVEFGIWPNNTENSKLCIQTACLANLLLWQPELSAAKNILQYISHLSQLTSGGQSD